VSADKGAVKIGLFSWKGGFMLVRVVWRYWKRALQLQRLQPPQRYKGKLYHWRLVLWQHDTTAKETVWRCGWLPGVKTEAEAQAALKRQQAAFEAEAVHLRQLQKPRTETDRQIEKARLKVLAKPFPVTVRLLRQIELHKRLAEKIGQTAEIGALQRQAVAVWTVEAEKLYGADVLTISTERELAAVLADAIRRQGKPEDRVAYELALNWKDKGYNKMTAKEYAHAIAKATKQPFTPAFVELVTKRRQRLGLKTLRRPGLPERAWR
jgi:hypothetical protein